MSVRSGKSVKNQTKQLLLVLLFILVCVLLSNQINFEASRRDSGVRYQNGVFMIPDSTEMIYISKNLTFVPNVDYTDIDSGEFSYYDFMSIPYASDVSISETAGWSDLGEDAIIHNYDRFEGVQPITREGKTKVCGVYLMTLHFENANTTYHLNVPNVNGLVKIYCNDNNLGFLWRRVDEWTPTFGYGYGYVPITPDSDGIARIMIAVSTNTKIHNPGIVSFPAVIQTSEAMTVAIIPSLWLMIQLILYAFILIGGFLISRTFKNRSIFYYFIIIELLIIIYTMVDCNFIALDTYNREILKFILFIAINTTVFILINATLNESDKAPRQKFMNLMPVLVTVGAILLVFWTVFEAPVFTNTFPLIPEVAFIVLIGLLAGYKLIFFHFGERGSLYVTIMIVCQIFFSANTFSTVNRTYNIPTYSVFFVIANVTLEFFFIMRYVIQSRKLEDTMEHMQFLVQEKTLRISEINKDLFNTNKRLMENEQARKNVLSNVSHDLRTPITAIRGYAEILLSRKGNLTDSQEENYLRNIIRRAEQMERIISDIVELTRLESNVNEFQFMDVSISELIDEICMMYEADLQDTKKKIVVEIPEDDFLFVKADPKKLSRVFENLISNAINYTFEEAVIKVKAWRGNEDQDISKQTINIDISDNGIGIPEAEIPMIFDRFYRAKNSGQNIKGTGIGLSIVKTIIDRHDASISVRSAIGKGTTFHIEMKATYR